MKKGYLVIAQNSKHDYVRMSYALALSIAITQKKVRKLSIAVDKDTVVPDKYKTVFDQVLTIPFQDDAELSEWKINNKWNTSLSVSSIVLFIAAIHYFYMKHNSRWRLTLELEAIHAQ